MKSKLTLLSLALFMTGCGYDDFDNYPPQPLAVEPYNISISDLRDYYKGETLLIDRDIVIRASVTTSDEANNFYRTFVIEDASGAVEIRAGLYDMHNIYPAGQRLTVKLNGLAMGMDQGLLQLGLKTFISTYYQTQYMGQRAIVDRYVIREGIYEPHIPLKTTIKALKENMCGRLVTITGLRFAGDPSSTWGVPSSNSNIPPTTGYRKFKTATADSLLVASSGYADFAASHIPVNYCTITGILLYGPAPGTAGRSVYMLKIRDLNDVIE